MQVSQKQSVVYVYEFTEAEHAVVAPLIAQALARAGQLAPIGEEPREKPPSPHRPYAADGVKLALPER